MKEQNTEEKIREYWTSHGFLSDVSNKVIEQVKESNKQLLTKILEAWPKEEEGKYRTEAFCLSETRAIIEKFLSEIV